MRAFGLAAFCAMLASGTATYAHHSYVSLFDKSREQSVTGVISDLAYRNPHITFRVKADDGESWQMELPSLSQAENRGLTSAFIQDGTRATVTGWPATSGAKELGVVRVTVGDRSVQVR